MPASIDVPDSVGFELAGAAAADQRPTSWLREFLTRPFKDLDGRASWKQERAEREKRLRAKAGRRR